VIKVIYIGGYGRSGSSLLEYLMTGSSSILACGEVASSLRKRIANAEWKSCSCGRAADECPVWGFLHDSNQPIPNNHTELLHELVENAGSRYTALVDSSKTSWGSLSAPFRLRRKFGPQFTLVHLTREPTAVCWSVLKKKDRQARRKGRTLRHRMLRCGWVVLGWGFANLSCEIFASVHRRQYLRLRYEDLARSPADTLQVLFAGLSLKARWDAKRGSDDNRHQLHGNRIRFREITVEDVKEDLSWKTEMPAKYSRTVRYLSYLLRLRYGYASDMGRGECTEDG
jgi:Sulfotransferase family